MTDNLLTTVKECKGQLPDEVLGRVICLLKGYSFNSIRCCTGDDGREEFQTHSIEKDYLWVGYRVVAPDVSIDAALALFSEALLKWSIRISYSEGMRHVNAVAGRSYPTNATVAFDHHTAPLAILACALSALSKEGQAI